MPSTCPTCMATACSSPGAVCRQGRLRRPRVHALNRALTDAIANPDLAIDALTKRNASISRDVNRTCLAGTFGSEMAHPEGARIGIGDIDDARLFRLIDLVIETKHLPRKPTVREVFDRSFLPAGAERIRTLAR